MATTLTGVIGGGLATVKSVSGTPTPWFLPFADRAAMVELQYEGTLEFAKSFSRRGVSGSTGACLVTENAKLMLKNTDITWSWLQKSFATFDDVATGNRVADEAIPVSATATTVTLAATPAVGLPVQVALEDGTQVAGSLAAAVFTPATPAQVQGRTVYVRYFVPVAVGSRKISVGSGQRINEAAVWGIFRGCGELAPGFSGDLLFVANRAIITPKATLGADAESPKKSELAIELELLRDGAGNYVELYQV
jgi:hypothetical protein